jgi:hypothetical protein
MDGIREELLRLDAYLGRWWAKAEILLGLTSAGTGIFLGAWELCGAKENPNLGLVLCGLGLFVFGGYLASAGHRSHLYRWSNCNTVNLIDEIRRDHQQG